MVWLNGRLFTYGPNEENWHRAVFDDNSLNDHLADAGFKKVRTVPRRLRGTAHGPIDLGMQTRKRRR